jgi:hypothetical protein
MALRLYIETLDPDWAQPSPGNLSSIHALPSPGLITYYRSVSRDLSTKDQATSTSKAKPKPTRGSDDRLRTLIDGISGINYRFVQLQETAIILLSS